jgi:hypothetical protein
MNNRSVAGTASRLLLTDSLGEAVTVRIDQVARDNPTVNALAIKAVLDETVEDYGIAVGAEDANQLPTSSSGQPLKLDVPNTGTTLPPGWSLTASGQIALSP